MAELEAFGRPAYIVVPNGYHRQDARIWKDRYPKAKVIAPAGARKAVQKIVPVDLDYADAPADASVKLAYFDGCKQREGYVELHSASGTSLVINDMVLNLPRRGGVMGYLLAPTGQPSVPRVTRWMFVKDRGAVGEHLDRLAAIPDLKRVVLSHGKNLVTDAAGALKQARLTA